MKIVIAGAGDLGFHLAGLLSFDSQQAITLIDNNADALEAAREHLDVLTVQGDASSPGTLKKAQVQSANLVLAVTTNETTNLLTALLAKKLGALQTLARVSNSEFVEESNQSLFSELGIGSIFSPNLLAAKEIHRLVRRCSFTDVFEFEAGKVILVGVTLDRSSPLTHKTLRAFAQSCEKDLRVIAVQRDTQTIIPYGDLSLLPNDHVYFITPPGSVSEVEKAVGAAKQEINNIMIIGGTTLALETAKLLENDYNLTLVESSKERCKQLAAELENTLVIQARTDNYDLLLREGLQRMDAFIALTLNSETNIIASLTAKNNGVIKTIAQVENKEYIRISQDIGVDTFINTKLIAANNIFRFVRKGKVEAITGLHGVDAEVIEFVITKNNQLTRHPLKDLHFPATAIVGAVIRQEQALIPDGNFIFNQYDKVIVFTLPEAIKKVEALFR